MHIEGMRTTVTLDQDVYEVASLYACGKGMTLGKALSELARKGREADLAAPVDMSVFERASNGLLVIKSRGRVITSEMVKAALEEELG
jgi:predicted DNA-binding ribbon-helix-helix protein